MFLKFQVLFQGIGQGTFGIVYKGKWRGQDVAVKQILSNKEKDSFHIEIITLTSVQHPNIIKLFGANDLDPIMIVMEFAECGSLYKCKLYTYPYDLSN